MQPLTRIHASASLPLKVECYGHATLSRLLNIIGLFCKRALEKRRYSAKETCNFEGPTNRSHPIHASGTDENGTHKGKDALACEWICLHVSGNYRSL